MSARQVTVGTTPVLVANDNIYRTAITITVVPSATFAANTGTVFVAKGGAPSATAGAPSSGDALSQGSQWAEVGQYVNDPNVFKGQVWAVSDTAGQLITVDETFSQG